MNAPSRSRADRDGLHVSASAIRTILECPREWFHRYVEGRPPEDVPPRLVLGVAIHEALGAFYEALRDGRQEPSVTELAAIAETSIVGAARQRTVIRFDGGEDLDGLIRQARGLVETFVAAAYRPERVLAVEEPFALPPTDPLTGELLPYEERVVGVLDLVAEEGGTLVVVDHKTAARSSAEKGLRADVQMGLYAWAAKTLFGDPVVELRYQNVIKTKTPKLELQVIDLRIDDECEAMEAATGAIELIHVAVTHPRAERLMGRRRTWRCKECGYRRRCAEARL